MKLLKENPLTVKLLDRYLLREMSTPFTIGLTAFLTVLCLNMVYFVLDLIVEKEAPLREILQLVVLRIPFFLVLALPVAILLAVSLAINRMTRDRELVALRMAGCSLWRILAPFLVFGLFFSVLSYFTEEWFAPIATHQSDNIYRRLLVETDIPALTSDTFFRAENRVFYFHHAYRTGERSLRLEGVMMYVLNGTNFPEIWTARDALVQGDVWTLEGVVVHHLDEHGHANVDAVPGTNPVIPLKKDMSFFLNSQKLPEEQTAADLQRQIKQYQRTGVTGPIVEQLAYEYWSKVALPAACLICALLPVPFNIRYARFGGFVGIFLALVAIFLYYNTMMFSRYLVYNGRLAGIGGAWLPDVLFSVVCLVLVFRER